MDATARAIQGVNDMERLTEPMIVPSTGEIFCYRLKPGVSEWKLKNKLGAYETAEEQGLLLRLPCKVGDTVYSFHTILECKYDYDCKEYDAYKCEGGCPCEFEYRVTRIREQQFEIPMIALLGKSVFLTKAEAEKALEEMG